MVPPAPRSPAELAAILAAARGAWPGMALSDDVFLRYLDERPAPAQSSGPLFTNELYLACACLEHDTNALAVFDARYLSQVPQMVAHLRLPAADVDDLAQQLRVKLLVSQDGAPPSLASYQGHGELGAWLRIVAVRIGLRMLPRKENLSTDDDPLSELAANGRTPELALLKAADQAAFKEAFREAMASLTPKEQNLLRQHYIDDLSIDCLGELHQTHRTSCARWLRDARTTLFRRTKSLLMKQTRASVSDCDSMIRQAQSQLEITFRSLLR